MDDEPDSRAIVIDPIEVKITHIPFLTDTSEMEENTSELMETIKELHKHTQKIANRTTEEICLLFYSCKAYKQVDADCIANGVKPYGCHILRDYIEKTFTAPPKGIDYYTKVTQKLLEKRRQYENLNSL